MQDKNIYGGGKLMWISRNILDRKATGKIAAAGSVGYGTDTRVSSVTSEGKGRCEIVNPPGYYSIPKQNSDVAVIPAREGMMCIGVRSPVVEDEFEPGEIVLRSDGGAVIKLSNDGNVYVNGEVI